MAIGCMVDRCEKIGWNKLVLLTEEPTVKWKKKVEILTHQNFFPSLTPKEGDGGNKWWLFSPWDEAISLLIAPTCCPLLLLLRWFLWFLGQALWDCVQSPGNNNVDSSTLYYKASPLADLLKWMMWVNFGSSAMRHFCFVFTAWLKPPPSLFLLKHQQQRQFWQPEIGEPRVLCSSFHLPATEGHV